MKKISSGFEKIFLKIRKNNSFHKLLLKKILKNEKKDLTNEKKNVILYVGLYLKNYVYKTKSIK
jgi:hypothetical protein